MLLVYSSSWEAPEIVLVSAAAGCWNGERRMVDGREAASGSSAGHSLGECGATVLVFTWGLGRAVRLWVLSALWQQGCSHYPHPPLGCFSV